MSMEYKIGLLFGVLAGVLVSLLFVALMIWRFCTYYLSVMVGAVMTIAENVSALHSKNGSPVSRK